MNTREHPETEVVIRFRRATGLGFLAAREFLSTQPSQLSERILQAGATQPGGTRLHDPIEDEPETAAVIAAAFSRAEAEVDAEYQSGCFRGRCHAVWKRVERILREESGIEWFSPARMNPGGCFD
ncbi:hypothetical protein ACXR0O_24890 [Verrucomicrobiota bacterium sgz303538]